MKTTPESPKRSDVMPPISATQLSLLTGYTRDRVKKIVSTLTPVAHLGRIAKYDPVAAVRAAMGSEESHKDRETRLKADILDVKLARMRREQIDRKLVEKYLADVFSGLAQSVKYLPELSREQSANICRTLREATERLAGELEACNFEEDEDGEEEEDD
jgi:hypothetical protein